MSWNGVMSGLRSYKGGSLLLCLWMAGSALATVRMNGVPYADVQSALDAAADGDVVQISGVNTEHNLHITNSVTLEGGWNSTFTARDPALYPSTLDALQLGRVIAIQGETTLTIVLRDLALLNGLATNTTIAVGFGGGLFATNAVLTLSGCTFSSCVANAGSDVAGFGGGACIFSAGAATLIRSNCFERNRAVHITSTPSTSVGYGGGLYLQGPGTAAENIFRNNWAGGANNMTAQGGGVYLAGGPMMVSNNVITDNIVSDNGFGMGGGLYLAQPAYGTWLVDNDVERNFCTYASGWVLYGYGGGIAQSGGNTDWRDNYIARNISGDEEGYRGGWGGGLYLSQATARFSGTNIIVNNSAGYGGMGGGVCVMGVHSRVEMHQVAILTNSVVSDSSTQRGGGGLFLNQGPRVTLSNCLVRGNTVPGNASDHYGGGICCLDGTLTLWDCVVESNTIGGPCLGGGLYVGGTRTALIQRCTFRGNEAIGGYNDVARGGGLAKTGSGVLMGDGNRFIYNRVDSGSGGGASSRGGGLYCGGDGSTDLTNSLAADNYAGSGGGGLYTACATCCLIHTTCANNSGGAGIKVGYSGSRLFMTNTIVAGHTVGITNEYAGEVYSTYTLFWSNVNNGIEGEMALRADPDFVCSGEGDYRIGPMSAAIDAGDAVALDHDADAAARLGPGDIGAFEALTCTLDSDTTANRILLHWNSRTAETYDVEYNTAITSGIWQTLAPFTNLTVMPGLHTVTNIPSGSFRAFRVRACSSSPGG